MPLRCIASIWPIGTDRVQFATKLGEKGKNLKQILSVICSLYFSTDESEGTQPDNLLQNVNAEKQVTIMKW